MQKKKIDNRYLDDERRFILSTTSIKELNNIEICPAKFYVEFVTGEHQRPTTLTMMKGQYFETKIIGGGYGGDKVEDLPRTKTKIPGTGEFKKTVDQERIDHQIQFFKEILTPKLKLKFKSRQIKFRLPVDKKFSIGTYMDCIIDFDDEGTMVTDVGMDLKLTGDITNTFGPFQWGEPHLRDHTQAILSLYLIEKKFKREPQFYYFIFDYKPNSDYKIIEKVKKENDYYELEGRINFAIERYMDMEHNKWPTHPTFENCSKCPLLATCDKKIQLKPIERI